MWTETYHCCDSEATFLAACDGAGWPRGPDGRPIPPWGVQIDVIGPNAAPPVIDRGGAPTAGTVDARWHVNAAWFAGVAMPAGFAAVEVIPELPVRVTAARDPAARLAAVRALFETRKRERPDDPRLVAHDETYFCAAPMDSRRWHTAWQPYAQPILGAISR